jgi:hypothetical protein
MARRLTALYEEIVAASSAIGDMSRKAKYLPTLPAVRDVD